MNFWALIGARFARPAEREMIYLVVRPDISVSEANRFRGNPLEYLSVDPIRGLKIAKSNK
jgi:hypothetical protein